jgi:hypothetical protein
MVGRMVKGERREGLEEDEGEGRGNVVGRFCIVYWRSHHGDEV